MAADRRPRWASINANHMLPSGSSLFHPQLQGIVDSQPTTMRACWRTCTAQRSQPIWEAERRGGERYLGDTGRIQWMASFAPIAPAEVRAFAMASPRQQSWTTI